MRLPMMVNMRSSRTTFLASAIIFLCILYWISKSSDSVSSLSKPLTTPLRDRYQSSTSSSTSISSDKYSTLDLVGDDDDSSPTSTTVNDDSEKPLSLGQSQLDIPSSYDAKFPRQIWQTANTEGRAKYATQSYTWASIKGFKYNFLTDDDATEWVHTNFAKTPSIVNFWNDLQAVVLKADFLRYLIMLSQGGIYADIDTSCLAHPDVWIPSSLGASEINAIIGIEYDDDTYNMFVRPISFCQWTLMAKPNHPIFQRAVQRVMSNLEFLARKQRVSMRRLTLQKLDVLEATGPGMITDVVMSVIRDQGHNITWSSFHNQTEPKLFGDILILPINGFAGSQKHSHAGDPAYGELLVQHHFGRTWYKTADGKNKQVMSKEMEEEQKGRVKDTTDELKEIMDAVKEKEQEEVKLYKEGKKDDGKIRVPVPNAALQKTTARPQDVDGDVATDDKDSATGQQPSLKNELPNADSKSTLDMEKQKTTDHTKLSSDDKEITDKLNPKSKSKSISTSKFEAPPEPNDQKSTSDSDSSSDSQSKPTKDTKEIKDTQTTKDAKDTTSTMRTNTSSDTKDTTSTNTHTDTSSEKLPDASSDTSSDTDISNNDTDNPIQKQSDRVRDNADDHET